MPLSEALTIDMCFQNYLETRDVNANSFCEGVIMLKASKKLLFISLLILQKIDLGVDKCIISDRIDSTNSVRIFAKIQRFLIQRTDEFNTNLWRNSDNYPVARVLDVIKFA